MPEASRETNGQATTVLLANGHRLFRLGLKEVLSADGSIEVLGEAENDEEAVTLTEETKPDVVVLDTDDEPVTGVQELISRILEIPPPPGVILIAAQHSSSRPVLELLARGVSAYLDKDASPEDLIAVVRTTVHSPRGKNAFAAVPRAALARAGQEARDRLSRRELEVLLWRSGA